MATESIAKDIPGEELHTADAAAPSRPIRDDSLPAPATAMEAAPEMEAADSDAEVERQMHRMSRRSFLWGGVALAAGFTGWRWLISRRQDEGLPWPMRRALEVNEQFARDYFSIARLAPTFPVSSLTEARVNGDLGLGQDFEPGQWMLRVAGLADTSHLPHQDTVGDETLGLFSLADIKALPKVEMITELKCIEGWSIIVHWTGARLVDFMQKYPPATKSGDPPNVRDRPQDLVSYVSLSTPDNGYYVGLEMESALHPQTLLCYEMNGQPLTPEHGAPLRLVTPVKYGIKNIKRIGTIRYSDTRPTDYWYEQGYDWYAGH